MVTNGYQATSSIAAADINIAQNAGSIIDPPSPEVSSLFAFSASQEGVNSSGTHRMRRTRADYSPSSAGHRSSPHRPRTFCVSLSSSAIALLSPFVISFSAIYIPCLAPTRNTASMTNANGERWRVLNMSCTRPVRRCPAVIRYERAVTRSTYPHYLDPSQFFVSTLRSFASLPLRSALTRAVFPQAALFRGFSFPNGSATRISARDVASRSSPRYDLSRLASRALINRRNLRLKQR